MLVELIKDYYTADRDGNKTLKWPKGTIAAIVKETKWQVVLLFLDGNQLVFSPKDIKRK